MFGIQIIVQIAYYIQSFYRYCIGIRGLDVERFSLMIPSFLEGPTKYIAPTGPVFCKRIVAYNYVGLCQISFRHIISYDLLVNLIESSLISLRLVSKAERRS